MVKKRPSNVDAWLERETPHVRKALESASKYFDGNDSLTVNTLEAVYGQESSFGALLGTRGATGAAGHFQFKPDTAKQYGVSVSKGNDQRFDIDYASSAAARYLKDLDSMFSKNTTLLKGSTTIAVTNSQERYKFVLGAYSAGQGRIAGAQHLAENAWKNSQLWADVQPFLESAGADDDTARETREYVEKVPVYEAEFTIKSPIDKTIKQRKPRKEPYRCTEGHWVTIDERPVFICD